MDVSRSRGSITRRIHRRIGFTLLYFKMAVMPLVLETKMADVTKLISLGNLLARKTTWLVFTTMSATSILSRVFGANYMTRIVNMYSHLPTLILFHIFSKQQVTPTNW